MSVPYLLTGTTGGLGTKILHDMLNVHHIPGKDIIATSRSEKQREKYEAMGVQFRVADFDKRETLDAAFKGVQNVLFMSSSERDNTKRNAQHRNVVDALKAANVQRTWYVSLAFGGYEDHSTVVFQLAHYETENWLLEAGLDCISLRSGVYADAFPLFLNWYPSSKSVLMPITEPPVSKCYIAWTSRTELGEAMATLLSKPLSSFPADVQPHGKKHIILLTGPKAENMPEIVDAISKGRGSPIPIEYLQPQEWVDAEAKDDVGHKARAWFEARLKVIESCCNGDAITVSSALGTVLGRKPETGSEAIERLIKENPDFTWHQNHAS